MMRMIRPLTLWVLLAATLLAWQSVAARELPDFTELVEEAAPGVVSISTSRTVPGRSDPFQGFGGQELPEIFRHFFGDRFPAPPGGQAPGRPQERQSLGSGFIISDDGYILTNAHVVDGADEILVRLNDRRELAAELVGSDERTDVALLKVDADALPTLKLGDSDVLRVGEWVAAIGSPFGFDHSVTAGIVSAIDRTLPRDAYVPFIQTDVAINPGNSGGPLFNLDGEVVGINSQIFTRSGGFMGLSFAIPINVAMDVADQLRDDGQVRRGWLGVMIQPVNRDLAESFGLKRPRGALIAEVMEGSPAESGGLQSGDIVLEFNGEAVQRSSDLPPMVGRTAVGESARLTVLLEGREMDLDVEIGRLPEDGETAVSPEVGSNENSGANPLGLAVESLNDEMARAAGVDGGVLVSGVGQGAAYEAGIRPRDIITEINRKQVRSVDEFRKVVAGLPDNRAVSVRIVRQGRAIYLVMKP